MWLFHIIMADFLQQTVSCSSWNSGLIRLCCSGTEVQGRALRVSVGQQKVQCGLLAMLLGIHDFHVCLSNMVACAM